MFYLWEYTWMGETWARYMQIRTYIFVKLDNMWETAKDARGMVK